MRWRIAPPPPDDDVARLAAELGVAPALAALLVQRSLRAGDEARTFLKADLSGLSDPYLLAGMTAAVATVTKAVRQGIPILVHGDYDVDGQCATALLTRALRAAGATVHPFVPHRVQDGYDFGPAGLAEAERVGAGLILTCDCGITAVDAVATAKARGLDVVVTDHHLPAEVLPPADAVVDPQRLDDTSGLAHLCGTGVAFKLVQALVEPLGLPAHLPMHLLDYAAVATVADVVPLVGENRILVKNGLRLLPQTRWPGLAALRDAVRLNERELRAGQVAFTLAPRLNAAGRMADARMAVDLLLTDDQAEADRLTGELQRLNQERQRVDQQLLDEALSQVIERYADPVAHPALVLNASDWHPGVIGIVASRIVERYGRPTFLIAVDGAIGKGSGRSIEGFDLHSALTRCGDLLVRYGGHRMAAGLTITADRIEAFRAAFTAVAAETLRPADLGPSVRIDLELPLAEVNDQLEQMVRHLEPCGMGNAAPIFGVRGVSLHAVRTVGEGHVKATLLDPARQHHLEGIAFGWADRLPTTPRADVAFRLERNTWRGHTSLQARIIALSPAAEG